MATVTRPRSPRGQGDQLRTDLIDAALTLMSDAGDPEDVSIRAVAKAAGVSPTAAYRHFHDRDDLVEAACERCYELFTVVLVDAVAGIDDPFEALRRAGRAYVDFARSDEGLYRVLFSNPFHFDKGADDTDSAGHNAFDTLVGMVQACIDAGADVRGPGGAADPDATYLAVQVWTWLHGIVDLSITHPTMPWPDMDVFLGDVQRTLGLAPPERDRMGR